MGRKYIKKLKTNQLQKYTFFVTMYFNMFYFRSLYCIFLQNNFQKIKYLDNNKKTEKKFWLLLKTLHLFFYAYLLTLQQNKVTRTESCNSTPKLLFIILNYFLNVQGIMKSAIQLQQFILNVYIEMKIHLQSRNLYVYEQCSNSYVCFFHWGVSELSLWAQGIRKVQETFS